MYDPMNSWTHGFSVVDLDSRRVTIKYMKETIILNSIPVLASGMRVKK